MSTPVFVDPDISTQADEAQSPRVPVPFPEDPYEAIRQAYLVGTDIESEPFKDPVETETPESPHTVASPTPLLDSTPPTRHAEDPVDSDTSSARPTSSDFTAPLSPDHPLTYASPTLVSFLRRTACMVVDMYGCCINHKKTVKAGQTRTQERKECKRARRLLPMVNKVNSWSTGQPQEDKTPKITKTTP
ncbi:hypothetical protein Tco_0409753 [Tanacetum coccineum]